MDIMKKTKIEQYLQGPLWALLILAFVDIVFFFLDIRCGVILAVSLVVFLVFQMIIYSRSKQEIIKECMDFMFEQSQVQNYLLQQLPVPYALLDGNGMIIWSNDAFHKIVGENRGKSLQQIFPNLNRNLLPSDVMHSISHIEYKKKCKEGDKEKEQTLFYKVEMNRIRVEDFSDENDNSCSRQMLKDNDLIAVYFFDQTLLKKYMEQNENQRMVIGLIYIDNYEEILDDIDAVKRSMLIAVADRKINKFIQNVSGVVKRTERDKYFVVFEQKYLDKIKENKFSILDEIKTINLGNSMHMTLSISFGINGNTYQENYEAACAGMDLALGRGGDQAVKKDGEDIHTTIDGDLQSTLYEQFKEDRGCSVALNPYTGEVLALVSTPSYDNNDFVRGMDNSQWSALNENEDRPLYNRFRQTWCPGSTFKPVIAAIGLKVGAFTANDDFGNEGLAWQKDSSWGDYTVTTLHDYAPVILKNALIYSDNIYFAKAALKIGADQLMQSLNQIGFNQELPFDIKMSESQYSNTDKIETEIQLADSGYGQGQILVNPLHLASIYTAFLNDGNMIKPYLHADGSTSSEIWIKDAFSPQIVLEVMEGLEGVVNNPEGTGYGACREDIRLAGKTGTAELKATKEDTSGTEIGWFTVFTTDRDTENPILLISMVENVKDIGGSGYVVEKDKAILDEYLGNE